MHGLLAMQNHDGITAGVWAGNDNFSSTDEATGGGVAGKLWKNIMASYFLIEPRQVKETYQAYIPPPQPTLSIPKLL